MLSEILPANLIYLQVHCCSAGVYMDHHLKYHRINKAMATAHLTEPMNWDAKRRQPHELRMEPYGEVRKKGVRLLQRLQVCPCPNGESQRKGYEACRLRDRLDVIGKFGEVV